jgi:Arc/MetJ-type ribon-helix-helix transcriptional regulator
MSMQITVRIPDHLVEFIDQQVKDGRAGSRAAVVTSAVERQLRRYLAEHDAAIYAATKDDPDPDDLEGLARWVASRPRDDLD